MSTPRTRTGLAKLRGDTQQTGAEITEAETTEAGPAEARTPEAGITGAGITGAETTEASPTVAEQRAPAEPAAPTTPEAGSPTVALTKPAKDAPDTIDSAQAPTAPDRTAGKKGIPGRVLAALIAGVLAVAVLLTLVLRWDDQLTGSSSSAGSATASASGGQANADARLAALRAARQFAVSFFTYDYRNIDAYLRRIEAASTGGFRSDFVSKEKTLKTVVAQLKTVAKGNVPEAGAGIFALSGNTAICFVAADFNASNAVTKNGQQRYRVKMTLQLVKGQWLVSDFQEVV